MKHFQIFKRLSDQKGMSLIEILIVMGIIAGIAAAIFNTVFTTSDKARKKQAMSQIKQLAGYIKDYKMDKGNYPTSDEGLQSLVDAGYFEEVPLDPWGNEYILEVPGSHGNRFEIYSEGPDDSTEDDNINSWKSKDE